MFGGLETMYKIGSGVTYDKPAFAGDDAAWPWLRQFAAARACAMRLPSRCLALESPCRVTIKFSSKQSRRPRGKFMKTSLKKFATDMIFRQTISGTGCAEKIQWIRHLFPSRTRRRNWQDL
jgi:hypothetical protein